MEQFNNLSRLVNKSRPSLKVNSKMKKILDHNASSLKKLSANYSMRMKNV